MTATMRARALRGLLAGLGLGSTLAGCTDATKRSAERARVQAGELAAVAAGDVDELRRGLPAGAIELAQSLFVDGSSAGSLEPSDVRKALRRIRSVVPDLRSAKSTFMALATLEGVGVRSDLEEDRMAGMKLFEIFPAFAATPDAPFLTTIGTFDEPGAPALDDDFAARVPVLNRAGRQGYLLSGWTFRSFARHLQAHAELTMAANRKAGTETEKAPVVYVVLADRRGAFSSPTTPKVNLAAVESLDPTTLADGASGAREIEGRTFAWGLARAPSLGPDVRVVVLRSDL